MSSDKEAGIITRIFFSILATIIVIVVIIIWIFLAFFMWLRGDFGESSLRERLIKLFGFLAMVASFGILWGLIMQITENRWVGSTSGLSNQLVYFAFITYTLWAIYGWLKKDFFIKIVQTTGVILAFILLLQVFYYG